MLITRNNNSGVSCRYEQIVLESLAYSRCLTRDQLLCHLRKRWKKLIKIWIAQSFMFKLVSCDFFLFYFISDCVEISIKPLARTIALRNYRKERRKDQIARDSSMSRYFSLQFKEGLVVICRFWLHKYNSSRL